MNLRTFVHALSLETRTQLSYRADFWTNFVLGVLTFVVAHYFIWDAVFSARGVHEIGGYTLPDMILYVILTACVMRMAFAGMKMAISTEIYGGGLNKYLVFPVSFHAFKYAAHLAYGFISFAQLFLALFVARLFLGVEPFAKLDPTLFAVGALASFFAGYVYFTMGAVFEMVAFWADNVWSLNVMLRFFVLFLGGGFAPLSLYPSWVQEILRWTPFPYILSFPVRCLQGIAPWEEVAFAVPVFLSWGVVVTLGAGLIYRRGLRVYTGVGI